LWVKNSKGLVTAFAKQGAKHTKNSNTRGVKVKLEYWIFDGKRPMA
jgi:hypothetical protein